MATTVQSINDRARAILRDVQGITWTPPEFLEWVTEAQRAVVKLQPEAHVETLPVLLVAQKARQAIPATASKLIDIRANLGVDGQTPGNVIRITSKEKLDAQIPTWMSGAVGTEVKYYVYDHRAPRDFWVYPRLSQARYVEMSLTTDTGVMDALTNPLKLDFTYEGAILDFVLYRCFLKLTSANGPARAAAHYTAFVNAINGGAAAGRTTEPNSTTSQQPDQPNPVTTPALVGR